jgi:hypothetical protein
MKKGKRKYIERKRKLVLGLDLENRSNQSNAMAGFGKSCNTVCLWAVDGSHFCTVHHFLLIFLVGVEASNIAKIQMRRVILTHFLYIIHIREKSKEKE